MGFKPLVCISDSMLRSYRKRIMLKEEILGHRATRPTIIVLSWTGVP